MIEQFSDDLDAIISDNSICVLYADKKYSGRKTKLSADKLLESEGVVNNYAFSVFLNLRKCHPTAIPKSQELVRINEIDYLIGSIDIDSMDIKMTLHLEKIK